jgi:hypothetical protein
MKHVRLLIHTTIVLLVLASVSRADIQRIGPNAFVAGIRTDVFTYVVAPEVTGRQRQQNWCWAACVQMVLNYHGLCVTQEQVVQRVFGRLVDSPATESEILMALSGWAPNTCGRFSAITAIPYVGDQDLLNDLKHNLPLIACLKNDDGRSGHAYVVTAVQFHYEPYGYSYFGPYGRRPVFDYVILRDPWPQNESRQELPWAKFESRLMNLNRVFTFRLPFRSR